MSFSLSRHICDAILLHCRYKQRCTCLMPLLTAYTFNVMKTQRQQSIFSRHFRRKNRNHTTHFITDNAFHISCSSFIDSQSPPSPSAGHELTTVNPHKYSPSRHDCKSKLTRIRKQLVMSGLYPTLYTAGA
jgi:hypothetical protein